MRVLICVCVTLCASCAWAQQGSPATPNDGKPVNEIAVSVPQGSSAQKDLVAVEPNTLMSQERIPEGARIYVAPMTNGFDNYVTAGLQQKKVPVIVVAHRSKAEYEITGVAETDKAGWAKMLFLGSQQTNEAASVKMVNLETGAVVFAYSVNKSNSVRGKQSAGEACAKHIREKILSKTPAPR